MREIKFRAWDKIKKEMVNNVIWTGAHAEKYDHNNEDNVICYLPEFACYLMQFTGLKDKNGKEIYEGDVVECRGYKGEVKWIRDGFVADIRDESGLRCYYKWDAVKVIGNIYENPDLIKK